VGDVGMGAK